MTGFKYDAETGVNVFVNASGEKFPIAKFLEIENSQTHGDMTANTMFAMRSEPVSPAQQDTTENIMFAMRSEPVDPTEDVMFAMRSEPNSSH